MGGGRGAASQRCCGPSATIVAADEFWTGRLPRGQCVFVPVAVGVASRSIPSQKLPITASIREQAQERGSAPLSKNAAVMTSEP